MKKKTFGDLKKGDYVYIVKCFHAYQFDAFPLKRNMIDKVRVCSDYNKTTNSVRILVRGLVRTAKPMNKKKGVYPPYRLQGSIIDIYSPCKNYIYKVRTEIYINKEDALERFGECFLRWQNTTYRKLQRQAKEVKQRMNAIQNNIKKIC